MQDQPVISDSEIVARILAGDTGQFNLLVARYQSVLLRVAQSRLGNRAWAEDVVQETFLCVFKFLASYDTRFSFRTWLWTVLFNQCHRHNSRHRRSPRVLAWADQKPAALHANVSTAIAGEELSPLSTLLLQERSEILERLLRRLPETESDTLRLRFYGGLTFPEIAEVMDCGISTAKVRVRRGLIQLAGWLRSELAELIPGRFLRTDTNSPIDERERT